MIDHPLEEKALEAGEGSDVGRKNGNGAPPRRTSRAGQRKALPVVAAEVAPVAEKVVIATGDGSSCAHLGLENDPFGHYAEPSSDHRCYLWMQRDRIDRAHQKIYCLTTESKGCPWLSISSPRQAPALHLRAKQQIQTGLTGGLADAIENLEGYWLRSVLAALLAFALATGRALLWAWRTSEPYLVQLGILLLAGLRLAAPILIWPVVWLSHNYRNLERSLLQAIVGGGRAVWRVTWRTKPASKAAPIAGVSSVHMAQGQALGTMGSAESEAVRADAAEAAELYLRRGMEAMRDGDTATALRRFRLATAANDLDEQAWLWRGALADTSEEKAEAFRRALAINPQSTRARSVLIQLGAIIESQPVEGVAKPAAVALGLEKSKTAEMAATWSCPDCAAVNPRAVGACQRCGVPSPRVERELRAGGGLLERGLEAMRAGNEDVAYQCFTAMTQTEPENEQAWYWRAKTAQTVGEVIHCLQRIIEINPANAKAQADLNWALQRQQRELAAETLSAQAAPKPAPQGPTQASKVLARLRGTILQLASVSTFALGLLLSLPYVVKLMELQSTPELQSYLKWLPSYNVPETHVSLPMGLDLGTVLPAALAILLLHAAFGLGDGAGRPMRIWTVVLAGGAMVLAQFFVTNIDAGKLGLVLAIAAIALSAAGRAQQEETETPRAAF